MNIAGHDIGVCSWSLHPKDINDLIAQVKQASLSHIQLGLAGLSVLNDQNKAQAIAAIKKADITLTGGMVGFAGEDYSTIANIRRTGGFVPDADWAERRSITEKAAKLARELHVPHISAHVGFVPHKSADPKQYQKIVDRIREIADWFDQFNLALLMETGQEKADELLQFLGDLHRDNVHINFDPANMILYGAGDPIAAIRTLGEHIRHVHVKDANGSKKPGEDWGEEVPFGTGQVNPQKFLDTLHSVNYQGPLCIEREAGNQRLQDVKFAVESLKKAAT
jgi:sugar phosphate isomerase/epimerase